MKAKLKKYFLMMMQISNNWLKDDATAFNALKKAKFEGKGRLNY